MLAHFPLFILLGGVAAPEIEGKVREEPSLYIPKMNATRATPLAYPISQYRMFISLLLLLLFDLFNTMSDQEILKLF